MTNKTKRIFSLIMASMMSLSMTTTAFASNVAYSTVTLTVEENNEILSVSVPAEINLRMKANGEIVTPDNLKIINNSDEQGVEITDIYATGLNNWSPAAYTDDFSLKPNNTKEFSFKINGDKMNSNGSFVLTDGYWNIDADSNLPLTINAKVPKQTEAGTSAIAKIGFNIEVSDNSSVPSATCPECGDPVPNQNFHLSDCNITGHYTCDRLDHEECSFCNELKCQGQHGDGICNSVNPVTTLSVDYTNGLMLPGSTNSATFSWSTTEENNSLTNLTSSNPDVAEAQAVMSLSLDEPVNGEQEVSVMAKSRGTTVITGTLASGESKSFTVEVSELQNNSGTGEDAPSGEVNNPDDLEAGDSLSPEDITVTIPVVNPDGTETKITVTPETIPDTELAEGENIIQIPISVNGTTITITLVINIARTNPSNGLITTVADAQAAGWTFTSYEDGLQITSFENVNFSANINIPEQIGDFKVLSIGNNVFEGQTNLKSITIPDTITHIGDSAFTGCSNLESIVLSENIKNIGNSAFKDCIKLKTLDFTDNLENLGNNIFQNCTSLTELPYLGNVTKISNYAFAGCTGLTSVNISEPIKTLGTHVFRDCTNIETVILNDNITSIGSTAFYKTGIKEITIPSNVTTLSTSLFNGCSNLKTITINGTLTNIGGTVFKDTVLTDIYYPSGTILDWNKVTKSGTWAYDGILNVATAHCSDGNTEVYNDAYITSSTASNQGIEWDSTTGTITKVTKKISDTSTKITIDLPGFINGVKITTLAEDSMVKNSESKSWQSKYSVIDIIVPSTVEIIERGAFGLNSTLIYKITLEEGLKRIESGAFSGFLNVRSIKIPKSVEYIGSSIPSSTLTSVTFNGTIEEWNRIEKSNYWAGNYIKTVYCNDGKITIE